MPPLGDKHPKPYMKSSNLKKKTEGLSSNKTKVSSFLDQNDQQNQ